MPPSEPVGTGGLYGITQMKLGFICPNLSGHLNPMTALARELQARNHDVVFLYSSSANGLSSVPGPARDRIQEMVREVSSLQGDDALNLALHAILAQTESILNSLPAMVKANRLDALVLDTTQRYAELGAMHLNIPYIHVSVALPFDYSGNTPPIYRAWHHETTPEALARNREGIAQITELVGRANGRVRAYAERVGLRVNWADLSSTISKRAWIAQTPKVFDFEGSNWPSQFHHTGPFDDGKGRNKIDFPWERLTGEPMVYASLGTIVNSRPEVFRTIVAALAKHRELQLVLSIGNQIDPEQIGPVPSDAIIVKQAPQLELLEKASFSISHAGLNTVLESLTQGVPQVAIPVAFDQFGVAARIAHRQTGLVATLDELTVDHLSGLIAEVVMNSTFRDNARKLQKAIAATNGLSVAADRIEQALGVPALMRQHDTGSL
jgi:zeaxanthin glucosyltransferase